MSRLDARMQTALAAVACFGVVFAMAAAVFGDGRAALSVAIGAAIAAANLFVLAQIVAGVIGRSGNAGIWGVFAVAKMLVLFLGLWLLMTKGLVSPIPLLVGYGSLPIGIAIGSLVSDKTAERTGTQ
jgi:hypothetical protein